MWRLLKATGLSFIEDEALSRGAAIAFYTVTSLAPVLLIVISIAGLVFGQEAAQGAILGQLRSLMGNQAAEVLQSALASASAKSSGILAAVVGVGTLLVVASGIFSEMQTALNRIWKAEPKSGTVSRLIRARAASLGLVATLGFLLIVSLVVSAGITALGDYINQRVPFGSLILYGISFIVSLSLLAVLFAAIYKVLPDHPIAWRDVITGAIITAFLFTVGKSLIGWYLGSSAVASSYGAAGGLIVMFFWVYYSAQIFLVGAEFTKVYAISRGRGPAKHLPTSQNPMIKKASTTLIGSPPHVRSTNDHAFQADTPLRRAELEAAHYRDTLLRTITALEDRLSSSAITRRVKSALRGRRMLPYAAAGIVVVIGYGLARFVNANRIATQSKEFFPEC